LLSLSTAPTHARARRLVPPRRAALLTARAWACRRA
jgi:hypothetical protein